MIRFIDLGKQMGLDEVWPREFCFYTTITSHFVRLADEDIFRSWDEFEAHYNTELMEYGQVAWELDRFRALCPAWVFCKPGEMTPVCCPLCGAVNDGVLINILNPRIVSKLEGDFE